jgi:carboxylesterase
MHTLTAAAPFQFDADMLRKRAAFAFGDSGPRGLLCVHGFTGSPYEVLPLGAYFAERGWRVRGPLLPGHGQLPEQLRGMRWQQWFAHVQSEYAALAAECDEVYVAGLSMGGLLTLHLALDEAQRAAVSKLRAIAVLSTPAGLFDRRTRLVHVAHRFVRWFRPFQFADLRDADLRGRIRKNYGSAIDFDNPAQVAWLKSAIRIPLDAVSQLLRFNAIVLGELPTLMTPTFIAQSRADTVIARDSADVINARLGSPQKVLRWRERWVHELPLEDDAPQLFSEIAEFFATIAN